MRIFEKCSIPVNSKDCRSSNECATSLKTVRISSFRQIAYQSHKAVLFHFKQSLCMCNHSIYQTALLTSVIGQSSRFSQASDKLYMHYAHDSIFPPTVLLSIPFHHQNLCRRRKTEIENHQRAYCLRVINWLKRNIISFYQHTIFVMTKIAIGLCHE